MNAPRTPWWHFWDPASGLPGGLLYGALILTIGVGGGYLLRWLF